MSYTAPLKDMLFNIEHLARIDQIAQIPGFEDAGLETAQAVLEECGKLNTEVIAPLNWEGDKNPSFRLVSRTRTNNSPKVAGKACNTRPSLVVRACPRPLARLAAKCSIRPT
jgi:3-(methylthio)propanoyl-CoA dehydrogenase